MRVVVERQRYRFPLEPIFFYTSKCGENDRDWTETGNHQIRAIITQLRVKTGNVSAAHTQTRSVMKIDILLKSVLAYSRMVWLGINGIMRAAFYYGRIILVGCFFPEKDSAAKWSILCMPLKTHPSRESVSGKLRDDVDSNY